MLRRILAVAPVGEIKANLKMLSHPEFNFIPDIYFVESSVLPRTRTPGDPILEFPRPRRGSRCFVNVGKAARPPFCVVDCDKNCRGKATSNERSRNNPGFFHPPILAAPSTVRCRTVAIF